jgi:hypothetical protein
MEKENEFFFQYFGKGKLIFVSKNFGDYFVIFKLLMLNLQIHRKFIFDCGKFCSFPKQALFQKRNLISGDFQNLRDFLRFLRF